MASDSKSGKIRYGEHSSADPDTSAAEAALKAKLSRKRTKTGCLTCRKRRIKCGEERPVCNNCIKSKRQCEGYNQRVIFKQPAFDYQPFPNGGANITFQAGSLPGPIVPYDHEYGQAVVDPSFYSQTHPRPIDGYGNSLPHPEVRYANGEAHHAGATILPYLPPGVLSAYPNSMFPSGTHYQHVINESIPFHGGPEQTLNTVHPTTSHPFAQPVGYGPPLQPYSLPGDSQNQYHSNLQQQNSIGVSNMGISKTSPTSSASSRTMPLSGTSTAENWIQLKPGPYVPRPELCHPIDYQPPPGHSTAHQGPPVAAASVPQTTKALTPELYDYEPQLPATDTANNLLSQAAVQTHDDEYYDVRSDEEMDGNTFGMTSLDHERQRDLQRTLNISIHDLQTRRHDNFVYEGILDHYRVEDAANPLKNPATARVFAHFISVTGPSLSIFERHPRNASLLFTEGQIPLSQQGLWTYTMPVAALHHQGLLHSMLALASLHIARLQNASDTPSRQHYAWACKRINHLLGPNSTKRHKTTTIAASMLLGFYEIFTADHRAWNLHLTGSKQLFLETDFLSLTCQFIRMKRERAIRSELAGDYPNAPSHHQSQDEILDQIYDVDEDMISHLVGKEVKYDDQEGAIAPDPNLPSQMDLSNFEVLKDLYWWYLKQDAYQSIISGTHLLLDYRRWANCPPRAPIGRADAVYGSFDHLILLLGRIADFAAKDRKRKLRQMEMNGGQWRPAPGMKMPGNSRQPQGQPPTPSATVNGFPVNGANVPTPPLPSPAAAQQTSFFGMAPPPRQDVQMPSAYNLGNNIPTSLPASPQEEMDLTAATHAALGEYGRIRAALHQFSQSLGDAFEPLASEFQPPLETPFGNALFYRSFDIANLWAVYYMAKIIAIRSHPHMHPAAHAAAAIASQETAFFANEIGRINAAIVPGPPDQPLNPTLSASLSDSCVPAFFAAIQYQDPHQRYMTVMRIHSIALRTGWGTAEIIANGCETAWVKAAAAGRGPPYTRIVRPERSDDPRLNGSWERLDPHGVPDEKDDSDRRLVKMKAEARLTWAIGVLGMEDDEQVGGLT